MKQFVLIVIFSLFLEGCVFHSGPEDNKDFIYISQPAELTGIYINKGDPGGYLSNVIWGDWSGNARTNGGPVAQDQDIEFIEVSSSENSLIVKTIQNGCANYEQTYVIGRDFEISNGKIVIQTVFSPLTRGAGDPLIGPVYAKRTLGLDVGKQGKVRGSTYAAGLVYMFLPVAISDTQDTKFNRITDKPQGYKTCVIGQGHR
jgi:hypothetical protein